MIDQLIVLWLWRRGRTDNVIEELIAVAVAVAVAEDWTM